MRACQVCGCASWGPILDLAEIRRMTEFAIDLPMKAYVRCDNCKAVARADLLQDVPTPNPSALPDAEFPGLGGFMKPVMAALMPSIPAPPTRTERLVLGLFRSDLLDTMQVETAASIVEFARSIEAELDAPVVPTSDLHAKQPWLALSFSAREEFDRWVTGFLDNVVNPHALAGVEYTQNIYDRAVSYVQQ